MFNTILRAAINPVECAFDRLKARYVILTRKIYFKSESVTILFNSCFVLHSFCELERCHLDKNLVRMQTKRNKAKEENLNNIPDPVYSYSNGECEYVSSVLTSHIHDNLPDDLVQNKIQVIFSVYHKIQGNISQENTSPVIQKMFSINPFQANVPFL